MGYEFAGLTYHQFEEGQKFTSASFTMTEAHITQFAGLSGDFNPLHVNEESAKKGMFKTRIAHGMLVISMATGLANQLRVFEGTTFALVEQRIKYTAPVFPGDTITLEITVKEKAPFNEKRNFGKITYDCKVVKQTGDVCVDSEWDCLMLGTKPTSD
ncbi:MAG: MaoC/PaaZ C-terminal domain-containing protein [Planctomycetota bacterium]|jgi:acyl dehydratase